MTTDVMSVLFTESSFRAVLANIIMPFNLLSTKIQEAFHIVKPPLSYQCYENEQNIYIYFCIKGFICTSGLYLSGKTGKERQESG